jgi:hypothetical protein
MAAALCSKFNAEPDKSIPSTEIDNIGVTSSEDDEQATTIDNIASSSK